MVDPIGQRSTLVSSRNGERARHTRQLQTISAGARPGLVADGDGEGAADVRLKVQSRRDTAGARAHLCAIWCGDLDPRSEACATGNFGDLYNYSVPLSCGGRTRINLACRRDGAGRYFTRGNRTLAETVACAEHCQSSQHRERNPKSGFHGAKAEEE